ncbi:MAG: glycosyltransferase [Bacteroidetes bacterium]|nr:glycosyltransferase [Bacteroidota bacterium]
MRILEMNTLRGWRGGERQTLFNALGFLQAGHSCELLCRRAEPLAHKAQAAGVPVRPVSGLWGALRYLLRHGRRYDIIHVQTSKDQTAALLARPFHHRPVVYTRRVDFVPKKGLSRWKYRRTDCVVAISPAIQDILKRVGIPDPPLISEAIVARELDKARASRLVARLGVSGKRLLGTTAALVPHKDPLNSVRAVYHLYQQRQDFVFLHFGEGPLRPQVEAEIHALGLGQVYHLCGFQDQVEDFFSVLELFSMSSEEEGLGSSLLDAFIYGVPVVATVAGGMRDLVAGVGLQVAIHDPRALAQALNRLMEDSHLAASLAARAREKVMAHHSVEVITRQYLGLFEQLVKA